jgi:phospholipase C
MAVNKLRTVPVALSIMLAIQPFGTAAAANPQFLAAHKQMLQKYHLNDAEPGLPYSQLVSLVQQNIKYVFVLYQENRSFDSYFGTFPGAEGLYSNPASATPGFTQKIVNTDGTTGTIQPFLIGPSQYAADTDDVDHSHPLIVAKMDIQNNVAAMDQYAVTEELKYSPTGNPSLQAKQFGELTMAHEDCDTIPILWAYAQRLVLFDHIFQEMTGPSTPGNLSIIGAQTGLTQWALHPSESSNVPMLVDYDPFWGSPPDTSANKLPVSPIDYPGYSTAINLTYATLPLSMLLSTAKTVTAGDTDAATDLADVTDDVDFLAKLTQPAVTFGWYQEGFDKEPTDPDDGPTDANGTHASYVTHHNGPQYFGYVANNPQIRQDLHGLEDFYTALANHTLPQAGGVFFVKGGAANIFNLKPVNPDATVQKYFLGDDDHPSYSDSQISEALVAETINRIAASPYWAQSAIIITWDDSEGDYDHVPPPIVATGPDQSVVSFGPRVPLLVISPFSKVSYISHDQGSHSSVVKFIDTVFGLPPLATLPDELLGRYLGLAQFGESEVGPHDALTPGVSDLLDALSPLRLMGSAEPLPPDFVTIAEPYVMTLPQTTGFGCGDLGIITTDRALGIPNNIPSDFNPRPRTNPSTSATNTPPPGRARPIIRYDR